MARTLPVGRRPVEPPPADYARPVAALCADTGHHWWPLRGIEAKQANAKALCVRCGAFEARQAVVGLERVTQPRGIKPLGAI